MFRGTIAKSVQVNVQLTALPSNADPVLLIAGATGLGASPASSTRVMPGGSAIVGATTGSNGHMEIEVQSKNDHDSGLLEVIVGGVVVDSDRVSGVETNWSYSVQ
jgi:hypothetical protein